MQRTPYGNTYLSTETLYINPPLLFNASWTDGLLFNYTIAMQRRNNVRSVCDLYRALIASLRQVIAC